MCYIFSNNSRREKNTKGYSVPYVFRCLQTTNFCGVHDQTLATDLIVKNYIRYILFLFNDKINNLLSPTFLILVWCKIFYSKYHAIIIKYLLELKRKSSTFKSLLWGCCNLTGPLFLALSTFDEYSLEGGKKIN